MKGGPKYSKAARQGGCGGCSFPWLDWNNVTHYGRTDFDGDDHWSVDVIIGKTVLL